MADEQDPAAAMNNAANEDDSTDSDVRTANYTDAYDAPDRQGVMGPDNGPQHRAPAGEGLRAPFAEDSGGLPQTSVFDGKGNESVVVVTQTEDGRPSQGTGPDLASAQAEAEEGKEEPGSAFGHLGKH